MKDEIKKAAAIIKNGGVVAFPTETVYGLGAATFNPHAVARIFEIKERPGFDPLIVHISKMEDLDLLCDKVDEGLTRLAERFWPGPLTIVIPKKDTVPDILTAGLSTVAVRMPDHPVAIKLIELSGTPIAAPSANKFGMLSPTEPQHVRNKLKGIDYILEGGKTTIGLESTVIELTPEGFKLLRPGAISITEIEGIIPHAGSSRTQAKQASFAGNVPEKPGSPGSGLDQPGSPGNRPEQSYAHGNSPEQGTSQGNSPEQPTSPGLLKSHYSPGKPIYIKGEADAGLDTREAGLIAFGIPEDTENYKEVEVLSAEKDLKQAAINLFSALHRLDDADVKFIIAEPVPEEGIGIAIMDRLRKAAYKYQAGN